MIQFFAHEEFKVIELHPSLQLQYAISNYGRLVSFKDEIREGRVLKGNLTEGYQVLRFKVRIDGKLERRHLFFHRLVGENFLRRKSEEQTYVLHLNHIKDDNYYTNLKWATREEMLEHSRKSPLAIEKSKKWKEHRIPSKSFKLTVTKIMVLKKRIFDPNRKTRLRIIAKEFGISEMQLHRIKSGENWGNVKI